MESADHRQQEQPQDTGISTQPSSENPDGNPKVLEPGPAVRFASKVEEFGPNGGPSKVEPTKDAVASPPDKPTELSQEQIKELSTTLQEQRVQNSYSFQPFSLPASRVPSHESSRNHTPQQSHTPTERQSPRMSPGPGVVSPPLTPSGTSGPESSPSARGSKQGAAQTDGGFDSSAITPQASGQESAPRSPRIDLPHRPASYEDVSNTGAFSDERDGADSHRKSMFSVGPGGGSVPVSRESSPSRNAASQYYSRPFTPAGDANDPYAASRRAPQTRSSANIDQRFVFQRKKGRVSPASSSTSLSKMEKSDKRHSGFLGVLNKTNLDLHQTGTQSTTHSRNTSMSDLKKFFKVGGSQKMKKAASPVPKPTTPIAPSSKYGHRVPFAEDHGLTSKYGKIGRVLGSGAGGSVKLMKRSEDSTVFAVKEFRPRHTYETEKEYVKKLTAEFCVGSALHHGNIIETLDIVSEKGKWYEVMEYAPYDLFAIVMTGKMSKAEISCAFLQILNGVTYLHSMGLAHRDLKLDNVVVSEHGIMKIIDFGSAHVFKYPFESDIVLASGVVGSDPYLAPEVYGERRYDPQAVDIWSLAIIFCCMSLRRFPWKVPRMTDNSYKLFAAEPTPGHDPQKLALPSRSSIPSRSTNDLTETPQRDFIEGDDGKQHQHSHQHSDGQPDKPAASDTSSTNKDGQAKEVIRGPWRLLRLLPRESRHIIGRMLALDPRQRVTMKEITEEPWASESIICRQLAPGEVVKAEDHTHILEPPVAPSK